MYIIHILMYIYIYIYIQYTYFCDTYVRYVPFEIISVVPIIRYLNTWYMIYMGTVDMIWLQDGKSVKWPQKTDTGRKWMKVSTVTDTSSGKNAQPSVPHCACCTTSTVGMKAGHSTLIHLVWSWDLASWVMRTRSSSVTCSGPDALNQENFAELRVLFHEVLPSSHILRIEWWRKQGLQPRCSANISRTFCRSVQTQFGIHPMICHKCHKPLSLSLSIYVMYLWAYHR